MELTKQILKCKFLVFCCFLLSGQLYGQRAFQTGIHDPITENWRYAHIEMLDGKGVRSMIIDQNGHYWFGINNGVLHYDGLNFSSEAQGLEQKVVYQLAETSQGLMAILDRSIYLKGADGWTKLMDIPSYTNGRNFKVSHSQGDEVLISFSHGFIIEAKGKWHFYTPSEYFSGYEAQKPIFFHDFPVGGDGAITDIIRTSRKGYWVAYNTENNFGEIVQFSLDEDMEIFKNSLRKLSDIQRVRFGEGQRMMKATNGEIWITNTATDIGVHRFRRNNWEVFSFNKLFGEDEYTNSITQTRDGKIRIGGLGNLYSYDGEAWIRLSAPDYEIPSSQIMVMSSPLSNTLWVLGMQSKVYRIDLSNNRYVTYQDLNYQDEDGQGNKWFLHKDGRVVINKEDEWTYLDPRDGILDTPIRVFITSKDQTWIVGSQKGIAATSYYNGIRWVTDLHPAVSWGFDYRSVFEDRGGSLWFGAGVDHNSKIGQRGGVLQLVDPMISTKRWIHHVPGENGLEQSNVYGIGQSDDGRIWIGGTRLCYYDGEVWRRTENELLDNFVNIVSSDAEKLLVGSRYYGLYIYEKGRWENYITNNGLVSNTIADVLSMGEGIYLATDKDISYFDGSTWTNDLFPQEMLVRNERGSLRKGAGGKLWINKSKREWKRRALIPPGAHAYNDFLTVSYNNNGKDPETWIEIYDDEVDDSGNTFVKWNGRDFLYETQQEHLQYAYRLNAGPWSEFSKNTHVTLNGLDDGKYVFEVKARDLDLNEDPTPASVSFTVLPPVWKQHWFILMVLTFIIVIGIFEVRILKKKSKLAALNRSLESHQQELQRNNALLEQRNIEISNQRDRLQHLIKKNEGLAKTKLQFFTNITHEFRTPLTLIYGPVKQLQEMGKWDRESDSLFNIISKNITRLHKLINQLLEFRKIQTSSLGLFLRKSDLVTFVNEISGIFNNLAAQREIDFQFHADVPHHEVYFDQDKVEKIIYNVLSNAFKYTRKKGKVTLQLNRQPGFVAIEIEDSGIGMSAAELDRAFDRFQKEPKQEDSMGIGLAYTRELVERHYGRIDIQSEEGVGTKVTIWIPDNLDIAQNSLMAETAPASNEEEIELDPYKMKELDSLIMGDRDIHEKKNYKLLIVEDNSDMRSFLYHLLGSQYHVTRVSDGLEAAELLKDEQFDLVISDIMMPGMDGLTLCEVIKKSLETSHVPVILLSAKDQGDDVLKGYQQGADDYIIKPFEPANLVLKVKNILKSREAFRERFSKHFSINPKEVKLESADEKLLKRLTQLMEDNISDATFDVNKMCEQTNLSHMHFIRKVRQLTGLRPVELLKSFRLKRAKQLLAQDKTTISQVAYMVGYDLPNSFARAFKQEFGKTPSDFVKEECEEAVD